MCEAEDTSRLTERMNGAGGKGSGGGRGADEEKSPKQGVYRHSGDIFHPLYMNETPPSTPDPGPRDLGPGREARTPGECCPPAPSGLLTPRALNIPTGQRTKF